MSASPSPAPSRSPAQARSPAVSESSGSRGASPVPEQRSSGKFVIRAPPDGSTVRVNRLAMVLGAMAAGRNPKTHPGLRDTVTDMMDGLATHDGYKHKAAAREAHEVLADQTNYKKWQDVEKYAVKSIDRSLEDASRRVIQEEDKQHVSLGSLIRSYHREKLQAKMESGGIDLETMEPWDVVDSDRAEYIARMYCQGLIKPLKNVAGSKRKAAEAVDEA